MTTLRRSYRANGLRVIWTITLKDMSNAFRSRKIVGNLLAVAFLLLFYKMSPMLFDNTPPPLAVCCAVNSQLLEALEPGSTIELRQMETRLQMERYLGRMTEPVLGLILPTDLEQQALSDAPLRLDGIADHWVAPDDLTELTTLAESQITRWLGRPVSIAVQQGPILTQFDGGHASTLALSLVVLLALIGLSIPPLLMVEEKESKTVDALLVSPANSRQIIIGKALTGMFYSMAAAALVFTVNAVLIVNWGLVVWATILGALFLVALGLLVGSMLQTKQQATLWLFILMQPLLLAVVADMLAGLIPESALTAIGWMPTVAFSRLVRLSLIDQAQPAQYLPKLLILLLSALLMLGLAIWKVRRSDLT